MLKLDMIRHRFDDSEVDYRIPLKQAIQRSLPATDNMSPVWNFDSPTEKKLITYDGLFLVKKPDKTTQEMIHLIERKRCFQLTDFRTGLAFVKRHGKQLEDWLREGNTPFSRAMGIVILQRFSDGHRWCHPLIYKAEDQDHFECRSHRIIPKFTWNPEYYFLVQETNH